jgi:hypothetical protein
VERRLLLGVEFKVEAARRLWVPALPAMASKGREYVE